MAKEERKVTRVMPNNIDAEASVLGAILIDNNAADTLVCKLNEQDFYLAANRTIFNAIKSLQEASKPIDIVSVCDQLELKGKLDEVGSLSYISELAEGVVSAANGEYYVEILKRDSLSRRVIEAGNDITKFAYDCEDGKDALANAEKIVYQIAEQSSEKSLIGIGDAVAKTMNMIQDVQAGNVQKNVVRTDFPTFDEMTHGLKPGEMVLIAARPSVGKTAFALNIAANVAINHQKKVAIFSLEMPAELLAKRMLAYISKVPLKKMDTRGGLSDIDYKKLNKGYKTMIASSIYIDDYSLNSPADILSKCRRLKREQGLDLVIIDYLQLMSAQKNGRSAESRQVEVSDMSRKIKIYAKELNCPIIVLSQMSRLVESRTDHTPLLSDLRESGSIEQDADVVMFLNNPSKYDKTKPENLVILDVKKNRNGAIGEINLDWDGTTTSFKECVENPQLITVVDKEEEGFDAKNTIKSISEVAEDLQEVASSQDDMPFDDESNDLQESGDDDEYVDAFDDGYIESDDMPF